MLDTLTYVEKLKEAGFTEKQAKVQVEATALLVQENLASKTDIEVVKHEIDLVKHEIEVVKHEIDLVKRDIKQLEASTKQDIKELEVGLRRDIKEMETALKHDIKEMQLKFDGKFTLLHWMLGVTIAGVLSLVLKAFVI